MQHCLELLIDFLAQIYVSYSNNYSLYQCNNVNNPSQFCSVALGEEMLVGVLGFYTLFLFLCKMTLSV